MRKIRIDPSVQFVWALANAEACFAGNDHIQPVHFLLAILNILDDAFHQESEQMGLSPEAIAALMEHASHCRAMLGIDEDKITTSRRSIKKDIRKNGHSGSLRTLHRSEKSRALFIKAAQHAVEGRSESLTLPFIWEQILERLPSVIETYFPDRKISTPGKNAINFYSSIEDEWQDTDEIENSNQHTSTPALDEIGRDLTKLARQGRLPPVVGRQQEMKSVVRYLMRTTKHGVMLTGNAGVGKTAIVEGLAQQCIQENAPDELQAFRFVELNATDLLAGTKHRGDMEQRLKEIIQEVESDPDLILFFDEAHLLVQSNSGSGPDIANILKPALGRDRFRCIAATTSDEFDRYIRPDAAFMRRFQVVQLSPPSRQEAICIAKTWAKRIEKYQSIEFAQGTIEYATGMVATYLPDRALPDSIIDLLENTATFSRITSLNTKIHQPEKGKPRVTSELINKVLDELYGITINTSSLLETGSIQEKLTARIIGQDKAINQLIETLDACAYKHNNSNDKPLGIFLFTGPTGVGKTFTAECLAEAIFGVDNTPMLRINMNEMKERHEISRLTGAPPGFIGHEQEPALFRFARDNTHGLILMDEMEKSHAEIQDYFLQLFDKGTARDTHGKPVSFTGMIFVMTCNLTAKNKINNIGFVSDNVEKNQHDYLLSHFRREFMARIDSVIAFNELTMNDYICLFNHRLIIFIKEMQKDQSVTITLDESTKEELITLCCNSRDGFREFSRNIDKIIFTPLFKYIKKTPELSNISICIEENKPVFR